MTAEDLEVIDDLVFLCQYRIRRSTILLQRWNGNGNVSEKQRAKVVLDKELWQKRRDVLQKLVKQQECDNER